MSVKAKEKKLDHYATVIKVIGIGGAGCNAIDKMVNTGLNGVEHWGVNTDAQALASCKTKNKILLARTLTFGLGAGGDPRIGLQALRENIDKITNAISGADVIFLACGMGGGTGTGATPEIAKVAKNLGILTIAVVTKPFLIEGTRRMLQAQQGIETLQENVDALIVIPNSELLTNTQKKTYLQEAFQLADDILVQGVQSIANMISTCGLINIDLADIKNVLQNSGLALMGVGKSERGAKEATQIAINCPLLETSQLVGATGIILNVAGSENLTLYEVHEAANLIYELVGENTNIVFGTTCNPTLEDKVQVTIIATGLSKKSKNAESTTMTNFEEIPDKSKVKKEELILKEWDNSTTIDKIRKKVSEVFVIPDFLYQKK